jgi:hypothetical protein
MAHYARVVNGIVTAVIVAEQSFIDNYVDPTPQLNKYPSQWIKTSYNTRGGVHYEPNSNTPSQDQSKALRGNYAGVGYIYDNVLDAFYAPQPYSSWTLNTQTYSWDPPTPYPTDGKFYQWDESTLSWKEQE